MQFASKDEGTIDPSTPAREMRKPDWMSLPNEICSHHLTGLLGLIYISLFVLCDQKFSSWPKA